MDVSEHVNLIDGYRKSKLESLPRAIEGEAPQKRLLEIVKEIHLLKEIKDQLITHNE